MKPGKVRPLAICLFRRADTILVAEGFDSVKHETFYRPLGGKIEFGEYGDDTVRRELLEEIGEEVKDLRYLGIVQNIFTYNGEQGHEIVLVYDGAFVDESVYTRQDINGIESAEDPAEIIKAVWKSLDFFRAGHAPLYPDGLLELLNKG